MINMTRYTAAEFARLQFPPCPVCGTTVEADRLDCTTRADMEERGERLYLVGRWSCPRGCNPDTGQRYHGENSITKDVSGNIRLRCSCGFDDYVSDLEELNRHKIGTFS